MLNKSDIRKTIRNQRKLLSSNDVHAASTIICKKILKHSAYINAKKVALYISHENEIDLSEILNHARKLKKHAYLPVLNDKDELVFYAVNSNTKFIKNKFGIDEPIISSQSSISPSELDLILIPLVAFDVQNNRLGRGAGHYDRALQFTQTISRDSHPVLIGVAYAFQKVDEIIPDEWDVKMDFIITENPSP